MGRPNKFNLSYFPLDVGFFDDHKVISIEETAGIKGGYIALRLMAMVYADMGYYLEWPQKFEFTAAKRIGNGITGASVAEVLKLCLKYELFDKQVFEKYGVITSTGIQKRWLMVMNILRRKVEVNAAIWLITSEETGVSSEETTASATESTQKEKKVNQSKVKEKIIPAQAPVAASPPTETIFARISRILGADFVPDWERWKLYKLKEFRFKYKSYESEDAALSKLITLSGSDADTARLVIKQSLENSWKGFFELDTPSALPAKAINGHAEKEKLNSQIKTSLNKDAQTINYLYDVFREDPAKVTVLSIYTAYYDFMKARGLVNYSADDVSKIRSTATGDLKNEGATPSETDIINRMKKIAVIELFKKFQAEDKEYVFGTETATI